MQTGGGLVCETVVEGIMDVLGGEGLVDNRPEDGRNQRRHTYQIKFYEEKIISKL